MYHQVSLKYYRLMLTAFINNVQVPVSQKKKKRLGLGKNQEQTHFLSRKKLNLKHILKIHFIP